MKVTYDSEVDVLRILLSSAAVEESDEEKPGVILDYDSEGNVVGLEVLEQAVLAVDIPVIAIGGITADNLPSVMAAGVWGAAVIGAVCGADDPEAAAANLRKTIDALQGDK